jgi:two-component system, OmpR family, sensor histidine kinase CpxA
MPGLFVKIFIWFWATVVLTCLSLVLAFVLQPRGVVSRWHTSLEDTTKYFGTAAVGVLNQGGAPAASSFIDQLSGDAHVRACLFDGNGLLLAGQACSEFQQAVDRVAHGEPSVDSMHRGLATIVIPVRDSEGHTYVYASELLSGPGAAFGVDLKVVLTRVSLALTVSGLICYFLTRYLTRPILRLRSVSQQISAGQLSARADAALESRRDEIGDLVRDFNSMANTTETLISSQRQLLYDVSHELRSPLARLNVALDLLRGRVGEVPALNRMQIDLQRLNETIGRLLTVAKLEASSTLQNSARVNLSDLVSSIAADADFEAQERGSRVEVAETADLAVLGDPSLLRSAIENVLRNALRFTAPGTPVEVLLRSVPAVSGDEAIIVVRDHGPGVPQEELTRIFKPFYRLSESRGNESNGAGLGLAIAERIVRLHGGRICAMNVEGGGLSVEIILPRMPRSEPENE